LLEANLRLGFKASQTTNLESRRSQGQTGTIGFICSARAKTAYRRGVIGISFLLSIPFRRSLSIAVQT
jgi:hypothetical protein